MRHCVEEEEKKKRKKGVVYTYNHSNWKAQGEGTLLDNIQRLCEEGKKAMSIYKSILKNLISLY